ncbi:glutathione S-transferase N-terminal domain-containing protein [Candidatus Saccharibacteria bacterium]|nr:glutathione S-transferase N-terminal domain-containing protein [Candidatus Saccharibacteria bacterium]
MITIYTTPTCAFCHALKEYLHDKNIKFTEKDLTKSEEAQKWVLEKTGQLATPVTDIDGTVIIGFDKAKIDQAINK